MKRRRRAARCRKIIVATEKVELDALAYLNAREAIAIAEAMLAARGQLERALADGDELRGGSWLAKRSGGAVEVTEARD